MWPPKGTNGCEITSFEPLSVKIATKLWPVAPTKKRTDRHVNKKIHTNRVFSRMRTSVMAKSIPTKFCSSTPWVDVVIYLTWHRNWLRGYGGEVCENGPLPLTSALASNTANSATAHTRESCTSGHMVTFSTAEYHWSSAGTKLCCLVTVTLCTNNFPKIIYATRKLPEWNLQIYNHKSNHYVSYDFGVRG